MHSPHPTVWLGGAQQSSKPPESRTRAATATRISASFPRYPVLSRTALNTVVAVAVPLRSVNCQQPIAGTSTIDG